MFFRLPFDVLKKITEFEENTMTLALIFKKNKVDNLLGALNSFDLTTRRLQKIIRMFEDEKIYDLQHDGDYKLGEAFFSYFLKMRRALELPDFIKHKISSKRAQIRVLEKVSQFYKGEITSSCPHKTKESTVRYKYDMYSSTETFCCLCGVKCEQH